MFRFKEFLGATYWKNQGMYCLLCRQRNYDIALNDENATDFLCIPNYIAFLLLYHALSNFRGMYCLLCKQRNYGIVLNYEKATNFLCIPNYIAFQFEGGELQSF